MWAGIQRADEFVQKSREITGPHHTVAQAVSENCLMGQMCSIPYPLPFSSKLEFNTRPVQNGFCTQAECTLKRSARIGTGMEPLPGLRKEWHLRLVGPWQEEEGGGGEDFLRKVKSKEMSL